MSIMAKSLTESQPSQIPFADNTAVLESLTRNEILVYTELQQTASPQKAYALLEALNDEGLRAPMTIYRALDGLIAKGLAKKIASQNAYVVVLSEARSAATAFVTCNRCGKTKEVAVKKSELARLLTPAAMRLGEVFIEVYGECGTTTECLAR